jgi:hypothetical protein
VEEDYHEQVRSRDRAAGDRLVPQPVSSAVEVDLLQGLFARYDPVALGGALGVVMSLTLFAATATLLLRGGDTVGANLSLLGNYLLGFHVSWGGAFLGLVEAGIGGFGGGYLGARLLNAVVGWHERRLLAKIERLELADPTGEDWS